MAKFVIPPRPRAAATTAPAALPAVVPASLADAVANERLRIAGILTSEEGKERPKAALHLAISTGMTPAEAAALLAALPAERQSDKLAERFFGQMDAMADDLAVTPGLTPGAVGGDRKSRRIAELAETVRGFNAARGYATTSRGN